MAAKVISCRLNSCLAWCDSARDITVSTSVEGLDINYLNGGCPIIYRERCSIELGSRHRLRIEQLAIAAGARDGQTASGLHAGGALLLEQGAESGMDPHLVEEVGGRVGPTASRGFARGQPF